VPLLLNDLTPLHWGIAGAAIAGVTLALLFLANRRLGISTGFEDVCSLVLDHAYFRRSSVTSGRKWRLPFLAGLMIGGFASALLGGGWRATTALGMFDAAVGWGTPWKMAWMFFGGMLIGLGTRLGGGCTSGHGIFGLSNFERSSAVTTASFMLGGIVTTQLLYRIVFPALANL
jgi:uncharacterized membrane protein YedE/YeeE